MYEGPERRSDNTRLSRIEQMIESDFEHRKEFRERIESLLAKHSSVIYGNGKPGILTRIKELETAHDNHKGNIRVIWVAVVGIIVSALWKAITLSFVK